VDVITNNHVAVAYHDCIEHSEVKKGLRTLVRRPVFSFLVSQNPSSMTITGYLQATVHLPYVITILYPYNGNIP